MNHPGLVIREATEDDRPAVRALVRAAWEGAYSHIYDAATLVDFFEGRLPQSASWTGERRAPVGTLIAERSGQVVGMAGLALRSDGDGELTQLYVLPAAQGSGVGLALWNAVLKICWQHHCPGMQVWVLARAPAAQFYANRGTVPAGEGIYAVGEQTERTLCYRRNLPC